MIEKLKELIGLKRGLRWGSEIIISMGTNPMVAWQNETFLLESRNTAFGRLQFGTIKVEPVGDWLNTPPYPSL